MKLYFSGLKMGMLLQLAVGPMCLMVFNTASNSGFMHGFVLVLAIALVDAFYIVLASVGASKLLEKTAVKTIVKVIGATVLLLFGLNIILVVFDISLIPGLSIQVEAKSVFLQGLLLTLSNPLTIVFWGSILTQRLLSDNMTSRELCVFSSGLVSATLLFLTAVALLGTVLQQFLSSTLSAILNFAVGLIIIALGLKMLIKKS